MSPRVYEFISFDFKECLNHKYLFCHKNQTNTKENCNSKSNSVYLSLGIEDHQDVAVCFSIFPPLLAFHLCIRVLPVLFPMPFWPDLFSPETFTALQHSKMYPALFISCYRPPISPSLKVHGLWALRLFFKGINKKLLHRNDIQMVCPLPSWRNIILKWHQINKTMWVH